MVVFMTDHGISHARGKQFLYERIHVPLIIAGPGIESGKVRDDLVEHIDIAALSLGLAGIDVPDYMQPKTFSATITSHGPRSIPLAIVAMKPWSICVACALRNSSTYAISSNRPHMQPNRYKDQKSIVVALRRCSKPRS